MMDQLDLWSSTVNDQWINYNEALEFIHTLGLRSREDWLCYMNGGIEGVDPMPPGIPPDPDVHYRFKGWRSWEEWLGTGKEVLSAEIENDQKEDIFHPKNLPVKKMEFNHAREFAWKLGLEYKEEWNLYSRGLYKDREALPPDIPHNPDREYRFIGWNGWNDWLVHPDKRVEYTDFYQGRDFVKCLRLKDKEAWRRYIIGVEQIHLKYDIRLPRKPDLEYADTGWNGWNDWLGIGIKYRGYMETQQFVHSLGIKDESHWRKYCSGILERVPPKPCNIFSYPEIGYKNSGWISWEDWLGLNPDSKVEKDMEPGLQECRCMGRIKDCPVCDGKGYI